MINFNSKNSIQIRNFLILLLLPLAFTVNADHFGDTTTGQGEGAGPNGGTCPGKQGTKAGTKKPVMFDDGRETHYTTDLVAQGRLPIVLSRKYNSRTEYDSPLGYGWAFTFDRRLYEYPDGSIVRRTDCGRRDKFIFTGGAFVTPPEGPRGVLTSNPDGTFEFRSISNVIDKYDAEGRLVEIGNDNGLHLKLIYDSRGRLPLIGTSKRAVDPNIPMVVARSDRLLRIEARYPDGSAIGNYVDFAYNENTGRLQTITDHLGQVVTYSHDTLAAGTRGNLTGVSGPKGTSTYTYDDPNDPHNVTAFKDPGDVLISLVYDDQDRAIQQAYGNKTIDIIYNDDLTVDTITTEKDDLGTVVSTISEHFEFNVDGLVTLYRDGDGRETRVDYHPTHKRFTKREVWENTGTGLVARKSEEREYNTDGSEKGRLWKKHDESTGTLKTHKSTSRTYGSSGSMMIVILEKDRTVTEASVCTGQNKVTTYDYDLYGNKTLIQIDGYTPDCTAVNRTTRYEYNGPFGQLSFIDGPRSGIDDTYSIDYYANSNALGNNRARARKLTAGNGIVLVDNIQYTSTGKYQSMLYPNGQAVSYSYYPADDRLNLATLSSSAGTRQYRWTYYPNGDVESITLGYNSTTPITITLVYDNASRLTSITDGAGNKIQYTLDGEGNRQKSEVYDPTGSLTAALNQTFDIYNNLKSFQQENETGGYSFDAEGKLLESIDGKGSKTKYDYDDLNRLISTTQDIGGTDITTADTLTQFAYNIHDDLTSVTDPNNGTTTYVYDDLGNLLSKTSPDTGSTTYTYDAAGNVATMTDAKGITFQYGYDEMGRLTAIIIPTAPGGIVTYDNQWTLFTYDTCTNGIDRLCSISQGSQTVSYGYNAFGDVTTHQGVGYTYDVLGRIKTVTYPSGNLLTYTYNTVGEVSKLDIRIGGTTYNIADNVQYAPFGPVTSLTYGNGLALTQAVDKAYRLTSQTTVGVFEHDYPQYDANGNLQSIMDNLGSNNNFDYDNLDRLTIASAYGDNHGYDYDKNGNRKAWNKNGTATTYGYEPDSNRLDTVNSTSIIRDPNGNMTNDGARSFIYNVYNRLTGIKDIGSYIYNGLGQRTNKYVNGLTTNFSYDLSGQLLGEYQGATTLAEHVYLNGQPIAVIQQGQVYYVHTDHLGTPRVISDASQVPVWSWQNSDPFGANAANDDVDGDGTPFIYNKRFAGQYYDGESGLYYNYFRYYDPSTGRYITSDPIGLEGGMNTYGYTEGNPINLSDPLGLSTTVETTCARNPAWCAKNLPWIVPRVPPVAFSPDDGDGKEDPAECEAKCAAAKTAGLASCAQLYGPNGVAPDDIQLVTCVLGVNDVYDACIQSCRKNCK